MTKVLDNFFDEEFDRFVACLNLTVSDKDGEAHAAILAANRLLEKHGLRWSDVIRRPDPIGLCLEYLVDVIQPGGFRELILSIRQQHSESGRISPKQLKVVLDAYHRML